MAYEVQADECFLTWCAAPEIAMTPPRWKARTLAAQALGTIDPTTRAVVPPIHMSTTFIRDPDNQYRSGYCYGRPDNATVRQTEGLIAALESAHDAALF